MITTNQIGIFLGGFVAGLVDTVAGGGGLITVPLLLHAGLPPAMALGTDKLQAGFGELSATIRLIQSRALDMRRMYPYLPFTFVGSFLGSLLMTFTPSELFTKLVPFFMLALFILSFFKNNLMQGSKNPAIALAPLILGLGVGFYNGFFGPGTGAIWTAGLMYLGGLGIKDATIYGKPYNFLGNVVSISFFIVMGNVDFALAFIMGSGCILGAIFGTKLLLASAERLVLGFFRIAVTVTTISMFWKYY